MRKWLYVSLASMLMFLASVSSVFACALWHYQPETPKSLQK